MQTRFWRMDVDTETTLGWVDGKYQRKAVLEVEIEEVTSVGTGYDWRYTIALHGGQVYCTGKVAEELWRVAGSHAATWRQVAKVGRRRLHLVDLDALVAGLNANSNGSARRSYVRNVREERVWQRSCKVAVALLDAIEEARA